ncbi:MAG: type II toxin-antitoxin system HicA family toxin [Nitrosomonas sp.]|nr:type II toxin-antitoxin system HicA family toxin [Nitrosomonas sp.]
MLGDSITTMNSKHRKTLEVIFFDPVNGNLPWGRIEALLVSIGCNVVEGSESLVTFEKDGRRAYFHRPHPQREALIYRVKAVREFLIKLEIKP